MVTVFSCGKNSAGKVKGVKDFMVVPRAGMLYQEVRFSSDNLHNILG